MSNEMIINGCAFDMERIDEQQRQLSCVAATGALAAGTGTRRPHPRGQPLRLAYGLLRCRHGTKIVDQRYV